MHMRKFEADTLEEALNQVKRDLGPDAIILKTTTSSGISGAFKKKKIEITAAISEKELKKKANVDHALGKEHREEFYKTSAAGISEMIDNYNEHTPQSKPSYGNLGLNRPVNSSKTGVTQAKTTKPSEKSLDMFLGKLMGDISDNRDNEDEAVYEEVRPVRTTRTEPVEQEYEKRAQPVASAPAVDLTPIREENHRLKEELRHQKNKLDALETKLNEVLKNVSTGSGDRQFGEPKGLTHVRRTLKAFELEDSIVNDIMKKANFELTREQMESDEQIFEIALRELNQKFNVKLPMYSERVSMGPVITVLMSEGASGQSNLSKKICATQGNGALVCFGSKDDQSDFAAKILNLDVTIVESLSQLIGTVRTKIAEGKNVFLDFNPKASLQEDAKTVLGTLKRHFGRVEVLLTISSIHSEIYNRKIISKYHDLVNGINITHMDLCLGFGPIINLHNNFNELPLVVFGTGAAIPQDMEPASAERIIASMFKL